MCCITFISHVYDLSYQDDGEIKGEKAVKPVTRLWICLYICKHDTTGYFYVYLRSLSSCICGDKTQYFGWKDGISQACGDLNSYFKLEQDVFLFLMCFLCLNVNQSTRTKLSQHKMENWT